MLENERCLGVHLAADLLIILFRELAALIFEIEILDVAEDDFLLSLKQIPLGLFNDCGFQRFFFPKQRNTDRRENAATENAAEQIKH